MVDKKGKEEEINKAILEWLIVGKHENSVKAFCEETGLKKEQASKGNALEKKWGTILLLNKKIIDLEAQVKSLKEDLDKASIGHLNGSNQSKENESMGLPKTPEKAVLTGHRGAITTLAFHPFYNVLASCSEDASLIIWECDEFTKEKSIKAHSNTVTHIIFDPSGKHLASCSADTSIKLWLFDTLTCIKTLNGHEHTVS